MRHLAIGLATIFLSVGIQTEAAAAAPSNAARAGATGNEDYDNTVRAFQTGRAAKVMGGKEVTDSKIYPWQVSLQVAWIPNHAKAHYCGGTIYSNQWIVTAAHCLQGLTADDVMVVSGTIKLTPDVAQSGVSELIKHPAFSRATYDNDVALLKLKTPLTFSETVNRLPPISSSEENGFEPNATEMTVTGWGMTVEGGEIVDTLRFVNVSFVDQASCNRPLSYNGRVTPNMLCAGSPSGGRDSCQGDSGGPLATRIADRAVLAGVVSWGDGCARPLKYGVYTRASQFADWISNNAR
jgi:secreted trypsin-like serine protease